MIENYDGVISICEICNLRNHCKNAFTKKANDCVDADCEDEYH